MKRTLLIAVILSALFVPSFALTVHGQQGGQRLVVDTGVVKLGPGQLLRITYNGQAGNDQLSVRFRTTYYSRVGPDINGFVKYKVATEDTSAPIQLAANEATSIDITQGGFDAVRGEVIIRGYTGATNVNAGVLFQIIKMSTGEVVSIWDDTDIVHVLR